MVSSVEITAPAMFAPLPPQSVMRDMCMKSPPALRMRGQQRYGTSLQITIVAVGVATELAQLPRHGPTAATLAGLNAHGYLVLVISLIGSWTWLVSTYHFCVLGVVDRGSTDVRPTWAVAASSRLHGLVLGTVLVVGQPVSFRASADSPNVTTRTGTRRGCVRSQSVAHGNWSMFGDLAVLLATILIIFGLFGAK
jgi:hypothetical protein